MKTLLKKLINNCLAPLDLEIRRKVKEVPAHNPHLRSYEQRIKNMATLGFSPKVIYDCGAFTGEWALFTAQLFHTAKFHLFEPNPVLHERIIHNLEPVKERYQLHKVAIGAENTQAQLNVWGADDLSLAASSLLSHVIGKPEEQVETKVITLNSFAEHHPRPDFIKLDLQGGEVDALEGAKALFNHTEVFLIEFGLIEAYIDRSAVKEVFDLMYDHGFVLYDIIDLSNRPLDNALGSGDLIFVQKESKLKEQKHWK
ncbi:MAG: FkbM family methyltransferase [Bacteroidota bacterium]